MAIFFTSTKEGKIFKIKVQGDLASLSGTVIAEISLNCELLNRLALVNEKLFVASHDDNGGIYVVNFQDGTSEKVASNGNECFKAHSLTMYENSLMFSDTGDHSIKVFNPVTRECTPYIANGKGTRNGRGAQFVQPVGLIAERRTVFMVHCSTGCLRMVSDVSPLLKYLEYLRESATTFGLHQKK